MKGMTFMRKTKIIVIFVLMIAMAVPITAFATPTTPYSSYDAWFQSSDEGCAAIYKCSCNPVDNYLYASARVQYLDGSLYYWSSYTTSADEDTSQRAFVVNSPNNCYVSYVDAYFRAQCTTGILKYYDDQASR